MICCLDTFVRWLAAARHVTACFVAAGAAGTTLFGAAQLNLGSAEASMAGLAAVPLDLQSDSAVAALQVDIVATPPVVSFSVPVTGGTAGSHFAEGSPVASNRFRIVLYNIFNQPLPVGQILLVNADLADSFPSGSIALQLTNAVLATPASLAVSDVTLGSGILRVGGVAPVQLNSVSLTPGGAMGFEVTGLSGTSAVLEQSVNLTTWSVVEIFPVTGPTASFTRELASGQTAQFFRIRLQ